MSKAVFFRLLDDDIELKPIVLKQQLEELRLGQLASRVFEIGNDVFEMIPSSPFAYWVSNSIRRLFVDHKPLAMSDCFAQHGASSKNDFRFLRLWWEPNPQAVGPTLRWAAFAKGGAYSKYFADVYLLINWENDADEINDYLLERYPYLRPKETDQASASPSLRRGTEWILHPENSYFHPGITWTRRTSSGISFRPLPSGSIFADKGPTLFVKVDNTVQLLSLLAVVNSVAFESLVKLQLGAADAAARSYEVGLIQATPIPGVLDTTLGEFARHAHDLQRDSDLGDETGHIFQMPGMIAYCGASLEAASHAISQGADKRYRDMSVIQARIDNSVFDLYGLAESDRALIRAEAGATPVVVEVGEVSDEDDDEVGNEEVSAPDDLPSQTLNLLMWCVGVAFGRWDIRKALDPSLFPPLPEPFDPLPRCSPGALMNADGLPVDRDELPTDYPLPVAWESVLLDDPLQESDPASADIVARVRGVLTLLWGDRAGAIEDEACRILGGHDLRAVLRQGLFPFHIKRYSKSRRKAPIYWLLQSERRNYGVWLYYPRMDANTLFVAENLTYTKVQREQNCLDELGQGLETLSRTERAARNRDIDAQKKLVAEVTDFHKTLLRLANQRLAPDHNDGVIIGIAPLHELVPWREAATMWGKLTRGEYAWSTMSTQMRERGLIND